MVSPLIRNASEKAFQDAIVTLAHGLGWRTFHPWRSDHSAKGWPDLVLAKPGDPPRVLFWELKRSGKAPTPAQTWWLMVLGGRCFTPEDWETIVDTLKGGT